MGYGYKIRKNNCAHAMLRVLVRDLEVHIAKNDQSPHKSITKEYHSISLSALKEKLPRYDIEIVKVSAAILENNEHIKILGNSNDITSMVNATPKGREAYLDGSYLIENAKERLQKDEYFNKIILPRISLTLSILAVILSVISLIVKSKK